MPPCLQCGARVEPCRARPVPFCRHGFWLPPEISLHTFNRNFAPSMVTHRSVVVIISDGWDRGDVSLLEREMQDLKRRCKKIIWLNPLLASDNYEPLCKGMQAALPYLDLFLSVHNVNSLVALGRTLQKMVA